MTFKKYVRCKNVGVILCALKVLKKYNNTDKLYKHIYKCLIKLNIYIVTLIGIK